MALVKYKVARWKNTGRACRWNMPRRYMPIKVDMNVICGGDQSFKEFQEFLIKQAVAIFGIPASEFNKPCEPIFKAHR